jgi:hypothetical protein
VSQRPEDDAWLVRPATIKLLWRILWVVLALTLAAHFMITVKGHFEIEIWYGFGAAFGFLCCLFMVLLAKVLGFLLYQGDQDDV